MATENVKRLKSPCIYQIPADAIKAEREQYPLRALNLTILFGIRRNCLRNGRS
jgi:hypothetical protein